MYFYEQISKNSSLLNSTEKKLLEYFYENKHKIKSLTVKVVAQENFIAQNTIIRFCKKLGFDGYSEFKEALFLTLQESELFLEKTSIDEQIIRTKEILNMKTVINIVDLVNSSNKILIVGLGLSSHPAKELNEKFQMIGLNSKTHIDPHFIKYNCKLLDKKDLLILISASGETKGLIECMNIALANKVNIVSITGFSSNSISKMSNFQLYAMISKNIINDLDLGNRFGFYYITNIIFESYINKYLSK